MKDRIPVNIAPNGAIKYGVYDSAGVLQRYEYIKLEDGATEVGTPINKTTLLSDSTETALWGNAANRTVNDALLKLDAKQKDAYTQLDTKQKSDFSELNERTKDSLLRELNIMLNLSLGTSNIDAWADVFSDESRINASQSSGYEVANGVLRVPKIEQLSSGSYKSFNQTGSSSTNKIAQSFVAPSNSLTKVILKLRKVYTQGNEPKLHIYSDNNGTPLSSLASEYCVGTFLDSFSECTFNFTALTLTKGQKYWFVLESSYPTSGGWHEVECSTGDAYSGNGIKSYSNSGAWSALENVDFWFKASFGDSATVVWNPTTATGPFSKIAVTAEQMLNTGTIAFYISNNGSTWTQVPALNAMQAVAFATTAVYLKVVLTGNAVLSSVAWGGY